MGLSTADSGDNFIRKHLQRACPICGGPLGEVLHRQEFYLPAGHPLEGGYEVVACVACGFVFADTAVGQAAYDRFYAERSKYEDSATSTGSGLSESDGRRLNDMADAIAIQVRGTDARVLDLGCANGGLLGALQRKGFSDLTGVDPSPACTAATRSGYSVQAIAASLYALPDLGLFDVITLSHVLEHLENLQGAVQNLSRMLRPEGFVYIEVPDAGRYTECLVAPFQDFNTEHINHFSPGTLRRLMAGAGLVPFCEGAKLIEAAQGIPYPAIFGFYRAGQAAAESEKDEELARKVRDYIEKSQQMMDSMNRKIEAAMAGNSRILVWGTGQLTSKLLTKTRLAEANIVSFIDGNPIHHDEVWMGRPVVSPESVIDAEASILIASTIHQDDIVAQIEKMGLKNTLILLR
jgi:SAM-dependent methyltransferase